MIKRPRISSDGPGGKGRTDPQGLLAEEDVQRFYSLPTSGNLRTARVVARAWTDPEFRQRLLDDATSACAEMGYAGLQGEYIVALENTSELRNVVVCTSVLYGWPVLGLPPDWYKSQNIGRGWFASLGECLAKC